VATSKSLLDLTSERRTLEEILERSGGDLSDPAIAAAWDANCLALVEKVDAYAVLALDWAARADHLDEMAKQLKAKAAAIRAGRERLLERAALAMGEAQELAGETYRIVRRKNPASVVVTDEAALKESCPEAVREKVETVIDKKAVKAALERGSAVRGAMLVQGERIEVRP
jgi:hypothetical protein